jgi:hypothetical protein
MDTTTKFHDAERLCKAYSLIQEALLAMQTAAAMTGGYMKAHPLHAAKFEALRLHTMANIAKTLRGEMLALSIGIDTDAIRKLCAGEKN